jgi:RNA polymerase sigma-70 factor (ECF subfamily)
MGCIKHVGPLTDEGLLHNVAQGCEDCFDVLFLRYFRPILSIAYKILRDRSEAEDTLQDVFLAIHQQRERFDPSKGSAHTWILQFGYYKALVRRRYLASRHFYDNQAVPDGNSQGALLDTEFIQKGIEWEEVVGRGVASLPPAQRRVIELLHFEGHTFREISEIEGRALATVRNNYYRGVQALRMMFAEDARPVGVQARGSVQGQREYELEL